MNKLSFRISKKKLIGNALTLALVLFMYSPMYAEAALNDAARTVGGWKEEMKALIYAVAMVVAFIGALRIYNKWQNGDQDINKELMGFGGACIFLTLIPSLIDSFFNI
ncbi:MAG: DUF4134 family protein [Bergeyella zoohelcum]|nr:DUF4134 family protein [Bergeyella zoohelcum]